MKIKSRHNIFVYFINYNMNFNIDEEQEKLIRIIDDNEFDFLKFAEKNFLADTSVRINFLWRVLKLIIKYPQIELYLKNLLNYFTVDELEKILTRCWSILHYMCLCAPIISLNAFKIVLNHGVNVNVKSKYNNTLLHVLFNNPCDNHIYNILNLLIKYDIDLNVLNCNKKTTLDVLIDHNICSNNTNDNKRIVLDCIMLVVNFGAKVNVIKRNDPLYDFVEHYQSLTIKPAIKNENKT